MASWGDLKVRCFQQFMSILLDEVCEMVSRIHVPFMSSESPDCYSPSHFSPLSCAAHLSFLVGSRNKWVFWQCLSQMGKLGVFAHMLSFSSVGRIMGQETLLTLSGVTWGRGDTGKLKLLLLPSSVHSILDVFAARVCWYFSSGLQDLHKGTLVYG